MACDVCSDTPPRCDVCFARMLGWMSGHAMARGVVWGRKLRRVAPGQPWPAYDDSPRLQTIARRHVLDLVGSDHDERLLDALARACADAAELEYTSDSVIPGAVSFTVQGGMTRKRRR